MPLINEILGLYLRALDSGFGLIGGDVRWLFNVLVVLNLIVGGLTWALSDDQVVAQLARKLLFIGFFAWLIDNWAWLTDTIARSFVQLGLRAGGGRGTVDLLSNPGAIAERGLLVIAPMLQAIRDLTGPVAFFENLPEILLLLVAIVVVLASFFLVAIQIMFAVLTFKLGTLAAFILVPFALLTRTSFISERPLGWVVSAGVRLMVLMIVVGLGERVYGRMEVTLETLTVREALNVALGSFVLMLLAQTSARLANDLATGTPRLGALDGALSLGATAAAATYGARRVGGAASHAAGQAASAAGHVKAAATRLRSASKKTNPTPTHEET